MPHLITDPAQQARNLADTIAQNPNSKLAAVYRRDLEVILKNLDLNNQSNANILLPYNSDHLRRLLN